MAKKRKAAKKKSSHALAIVGLILNIIVLPGLGSLIGGKTKSGILQLTFFILGILLIFTLYGAIIGIPLSLAMWIWGIVTGVQMVKETE